MRRHDLDLLSLLVGLLFAGVGLMLLGGSPVRGSVSLAWVGPVVAIGLGVLVIVAVRPRRETVQENAPRTAEAAPRDGSSIGRR